MSHIPNTLAAIRYGRQELDLAGWADSCAILAPSCPPPTAPAADLVREALRHSIGTPPLRELAKGRSSAVILVPGQDRVAGAEIFLPILVEELHAAGLRDADISIVLATGTHAAHTADDAARVLGRDISQRIRWRQHDCEPGGHLVHVGTTSRGTPVDLDREVVDAGLTILTGRIIPHYFAGYGGGRKALLPGVAARRSIVHNHRLTLDPRQGLHTAIRLGRLAGNPVHEDMLEAARLVPRAFVLNTLLDVEHRLVAAVAGELDAAHAAGCRAAASWFTAQADEPLDAVVSSAGGWPYDCDYVQALKTVFNVQEAVRPGGALLWVAECTKGIRPAFLQWAGLREDDAMEAAIRANYDLSGHNSMMLRRLTRKVRVAMLSSLPDPSVTSLGVTPVRSLAEGLAWLDEHTPARGRRAIVPHANVTHATASGNGATP